MADGDELQRLIGAVERNEVPGGSLYGRTIARILQLQLAECRAGTVAEAHATLSAVAAWATATKPSMASVHNVTRLALRSFPDAAESTEAAIDSVTRALDRFIDRSAAAIEQIAEHIAAVVPAGAVVLVHSNSGSLARVLRRAADTIDGISLLVTESRPLRESRALVGQLADTAMPITLYSDAAVGVAAAGADVALVGADAVLADGTLVNKVGTYPLALACRDRDVPLHAVTELAKVYSGPVEELAMEVRPGDELAGDWALVGTGRVAVHNQFFEPTPPSLIAGYVTEIGVVRPEAIASVADRHPLEETTG